MGLLTEDLDSHLGLGASALRLASRTAPVTASVVSDASPFHAGAPLFQNKYKGRCLQFRALDHLKVVGENLQNGRKNARPGLFNYHPV